MKSLHLATSRLCLNSLALLFLSIAPICAADSCPTVSTSLPTKKTGTISNTCLDYGVVGGQAFVDYAVIYQFSVSAGKTIGANLSTAAQQPLLFLMDASFNPIVADIGTDASVSIAFPDAEAGTYYLVVGVPGDQSADTFTVEITAASPPVVINHVTAKGIESADPFDPVSPTNWFETSDSTAWSWVEVGPISGIHEIGWTFYSPRGATYLSQSTTIGDSQNGAWWKAWDGIYIAGHPPAQQTGQWRVDVSIDGAVAFTDTFEVSNDPPPCVSRDCSRLIGVTPSRPVPIRVGPR